ncbi:MAG: T9SS type A sorting domain-containing protein [Bacteroidota bacterium]
MKKILLFIPLILCCLVTNAQNQLTTFEKPADFQSSSVLQPLEVAIDFSVTFTDGTPVNLFTTCNAGNSVLLDFFYTTCVYCQTYAPIIDQAYAAHGSGNGNIKFWGIDYGDNNAEVNTYKTTYGVTNPCASGTQGGGDAVCNTYSTSFPWLGYPTYSVVCPDHTYYHDVNYPPSATGFNTYFSTCGTTGVADETTPCKITYMYPLPAQENLNVHIYSDKNSQIKMELFDIIGNCVYTLTSDAARGYYNAEVPVSDLSAGTYFINPHCSLIVEKQTNIC